MTRQVAAPARGRAPPTGVAPSPLLGQPFDVVPAESRLIVLVYRAGPLAALGHNHLIACRCITGTVYLPRDPLHASFDLHVAVDRFTVDDPALRAAEHAPDFPPDVSRSARQGTRHNMLGVSQLNAARYPVIALRAEGMRAEGMRADAHGRSGDLLVRVLVQFRGLEREISVPVRYVITADGILVTAAFPLKQTDLGITPFSALGGALTTRDDMSLRLRIVGRRRVRPSE